MKDPPKNKRVKKPNKRRDRSEAVKKRYTATIMDILFRQKLQDMDFNKLLKQGIIREIKDDTTGVIK